MSNLFSKTKKQSPKNVWARPEMLVTFRAELMPQKNREERTFRVKEVFSNGRVILYEFVGEHRQSEFEETRFQK